MIMLAGTFLKYKGLTRQILVRKTNSMQGSGGIWRGGAGFPENYMALYLSSSARLLLRN